MKVRFLILSFFILFHAHAMECDLKSQKELGQEILKELTQSPLSCLKNDVHLTFDDGPSLSVTPAIIKELELRKVKATFFVTSTHLEANHEKYKENRDLVNQTLTSGHLIASHGHEHHAYDLRMKRNGEIEEQGFSQEEREKQIQKSMDLLQWSTQGKFKQQDLLLFRFPYGRGAMPSEMEIEHKISAGEIHLSGKTYSEKLKEYRSISPALQTIAGGGFSHLGWNHDSQDSSYGVKAPEKNVLKDYIKKNLKGLCSSPQVTKVALFHDIKEMNISAIPLIIDIGQCLGLKFISAQEMMKSQQLKSSGVIIEKNEILKGTVSNVLNGIQAVEKLGQPTCSEVAPEKSCWSEQYKKYYAHCSGGDSVCFEGKWKSRTDPIIQENCH
jgi:peptidoglycan/xylan/chitin deacetylase (PgdA/CDA1 family)